MPARGRLLAALRRAPGDAGVATSATGDRTPHRAGRRVSPLYATLGVDLVYDVGAGRGQFGRRLRRSGYRGRIVSFEPRSAAVAVVRTEAADDPTWTVRHEALGDADADTLIHLSGNDGSSSLLEMLPSHERSSPTSGTVGSEMVHVRRFDALPDELLGLGVHPALKIDTQGYELAVLRGMGRHLRRMELLQLELSLVPLYAEAPLYDVVMRHVVEAGFHLAGVIPGFEDPASGQLLQLDGIFVRTDRLPVSSS